MEKNVQSQYSDFIKLYANFKNSRIAGRYINYSHLEDSLQQLEFSFPVDQIGQSTLGEPISIVRLGTGRIKILAWSQMHGNESTTTKAVMDLLNAFVVYRDHPIIKLFEERLTVHIIPMLNPDGAKAYTRVNANKVDLNRDAHNLEEKESKLLRKVFNEFKPDFCFNLHDQRTIFSAGKDPLPATVSFLTPAMDNKRAITSSRKRSMKVIAAMNKELQHTIPGQVGRYSDEYNINCTGDTFQTLQVPTILFEAGHFKNDYNREHTRELIFKALFAGLYSIATGEWEKEDYKDYFQIPENQKLFYDYILRNAMVEGKEVDVAIQFSERLENNEIKFDPIIQKIASSLSCFGHKEIDCHKNEVNLEGEKQLAENVLVSKILLKNEVLIIN